MWVDALAAIAVLLLTWVGFRRGALAMFLQIVTFLASYALALILGPSFGAELAASLGIADLVGIVAAGFGVFCISYLVLSTVAHFARRRDERNRYGRRLRDRLGGAAFGFAQASLIVLLLGILASWLHAGRTVGNMAWIPDTGDAKVSALSRNVIETAASTVVGEGDACARIVLHFTTRPSETIQAVQHLMDRDEVRALEEDERFWAYLEHGQVDSALNTSSFLAISYRKEVRQQLADLGMADARGVEDTAFFRQEMRVMLEQLSPRVRALRNDPELVKLTHDPEIAKALEERDTGTLLTHPGVRDLVQRVLQAPPEEKK
jgi:uncharacterized membrane protein required for colicin V production